MSFTVKRQAGSDGGTSNTERLAAQKVALSSSTLNDQDHVFGTFDWKRLRFKATVPADVTDAELILGVEAVNGSAQFDDIKLSVLRRPRAWPAVPPKGPVLTSHEKPRLRGAMIHPDITPESSRVRGQEWKVNLIRWQLIRYVELFEENGWHWTYHAFREWSGWSAEHGPHSMPTYATA